MHLLDKILGTLHLDMWNRKHSPSQTNAVKVKKSSVRKIQQAGRDIVNVDASVPMIEVSTESNVSDIMRYDAVNIITITSSNEPLIIE